MMAARANGINTILFRNAMGRKLGLSINEMECLSFVGIMRAVTPTLIGKHTGLTSGATTAMLDRLEKRGFIVRKSNPLDRRGVLVEVTTKYTEAAHPLVTGIQKAHKRVIASYSDAELEVIADFLTKFAGNLEKETLAIEILSYLNR